MAEKELFGISEQLNDTISRQAAIDAFLTELTKRERKNFLHTWSTVEVKYFVADMLEKLPAAQPEQRWIPVTERLPEEEKAYLVTFANEKVGMSSWHKDTFNRGFNRGFDAYLTGVTEDGECEYFGVVAWMEKPEPWKGGPDEH